MNCTRPLPVPDVPASMVIQLVTLDAVHVQGPSTMRSTLPRPPSGPISWSGGDTAHVHADACVTVTGFPSTVTTPERAGPLFAATTKDTCAGPVPEVAGRVIHAAWLAAFHRHPLPAASDTAPVCAAAESASDAGVTAKVQPL